MLEFFYESSSFRPPSQSDKTAQAFASGDNNNGKTVAISFFQLFANKTLSRNQMTITVLGMYMLILLYFSVFCLVGPQLGLKSKNHKGSDSLPSLMGNYHKSYLHAYICQNFSVNGQKFGLEGLLKMMLSMGVSQISIVSINNQLISVSVKLSNCTAMIHVQAQLGIHFLYFSESVLETVH